MVAQDPTMGQLPRATGKQSRQHIGKMFTMTETRGDRILKGKGALWVSSCVVSCLERFPLAVSSSAVVAFITSHLSRVCLVE